VRAQELCWLLTLIQAARPSSLLLPPPLIVVLVLRMLLLVIQADGTHTSDDSDSHHVAPFLQV
jgi:hypothetical protein